MFKRMFLFVLVNILIITTISIVFQMVTSMLGISPDYLSSYYGIDYVSLFVFCFVWGMGGAFISLALSRVMAKWMMGVHLIDPRKANEEERFVYDTVKALSMKAGLPMPEVGIYEGAEVNAFATGPSKKRSLVAVSRGLLSAMDRDEIDGVLGHEISHIANGDMVTMTLLQGLVNAFVMFFARIIAFAISQTVKEEQRRSIQFMVVLVAEIVLGILGMIVVSAFSRAREYRADAGGAKFAGRAQMIAALQKLKLNYDSRIQQRVEDQPALATLKISGKGSGFINLFATHPPLEERIARLQSGV
jgi:heat shock protein HtpX